MGTIKIKMPRIERKYVYILLAIAGAFILVVLVWFIRQERLPGYNTEPTFKPSYIEPGGQTSEFFTGIVEKTELSIRGPKMTVRMDLNNSDRTFFVAKNAIIWLGMEIGEDSITGDEEVLFKDLKVGWRVAVFIGKANEARRINVLKRTNGEESEQ